MKRFNFPMMRRSELEQWFTLAAPLLPQPRHGYAYEEEGHFLPREVLTSAFEKLGSRLLQCAEQRRLTASEFNVFDFIDPSENVLSDILRFFLDPEESHGQGTLFLRLLITKLWPQLTLRLDHVAVAREALTYTIPLNRRRIDLLVTTQEFVLGIETKKSAPEGTRQVQHYCRHLQNIAGGRPFCLIFLTRSGAEARSITHELASAFKEKGQLASWSWENDIPTWLKQCKVLCKPDKIPDKISYFVNDFEEYIALYLRTTEEISEN
jgi:PD-(D/E)XK nuclease superfamily